MNLLAGLAVVWEILFDRFILDFSFLLPWAGFSDFDGAFFHLRGFDVRMLVLYMGIKGSIGTIHLSASGGAYELFVYLLILSSVYFLHGFYLIIITRTKLQ